MPFLELGSIDTVKKKRDLASCLRLSETHSKVNISILSKDSIWERTLIETSGGNLIPLLVHRSKIKNAKYVLIVHGEGKSAVPISVVNKYIDEDYGVILADLYGIGEQASNESEKLDRTLPRFHTLSRSLLWLGTTLMGQWVEEVGIIRTVMEEEFDAEEVHLVGFKETGIAALLAGTLYSGVDSFTVYDTPTSFVFDGTEKLGFYDMSLHVPGILPWGDVMLAAAICNAPVKFVNPRSASGRLLTAKEISSEKGVYCKMSRLLGNSCDIIEFD